MLNCLFCEKALTALKMLAFLVFTFLMFPSFVLTQSVPKIAIIGGGIGGSSSAYFLQQLFEDNVSISLFEKDTVGGRLKVLDIDGYGYEAGGSIIHSRNQYMVNFKRLLDLKVRQALPSRLGIYNGEKFVFEESDYFLYTVANLFWHYGLSTFHLFKDVRKLLNDFSKIYILQGKGYAYTSVDLLMKAMNPVFIDMTKITIYETLAKKGYSEKFIDEIVQSIMMVNYGQTTNITGFVGYVSLAGAENSLWSIEGGNKLIPEGLLNLSNANFIKADVLEVVLLPDDKFQVNYKDSSLKGNIKSENFDIVILSAPLIENVDNIKFLNFKKDFQQFERKYHQTVATFVKGNLNPSAFHATSVPDDILTNNATLVFNSIAKCTPVESHDFFLNESVYKVFSQEVLNKDIVEKLFTKVNIVKDISWLAYPHYIPSEKFVPFVLHPGLYYTNAIELSASAMEMSAISAKNVALLIYNLWKNSADKIDSENPMIKDEL